MTARNAAPYLGAALDALTRQTRLPIELVAHDDASDDATLALLEDFAANAPFEVRIDRAPERRGYDDAFMRAATLCRGDVIAVCDADDVWLERRLEICATAFERSEAMLTLHATRVVDAELHEVAPRWPAIETTRLVPRLGLTGLHLDAPGAAIVFRRDLLALADFERRPSSRYGRSRMVADEWLFFLAGVAGPIQLIAEPLILYRRHSSNDSQWGGRQPQTTFEPALDDYRQAAEQCARLAGYLEDTMPRDAQTADLLAAGAHHYRRAAGWWQLRVTLYESSARRRRLNALRRLIAAGAYGPRAPGGLGRAALVKDLVGGVALRRFA
jgi:hypothetical protein